MNIPGSTNVPGCEVAYRIDEVVTDPAVTEIVNYAGRTRSIIGTQTLINAGLVEKIRKDGCVTFTLLPDDRSMSVRSLRQGAGSV